MPLLFSLGRNENSYAHFGISEEEAKDQKNFARQLHDFDGLEISKLHAGFKSSYVLLKGAKRAGDHSRTHEGRTCEATGESPIEGNLHFYKENGVFHFFSGRAVAEGKA